MTSRGEVVVAWPQSGARAGRPGPIVGPLTVRAAVRSTRGAWSTPRIIGRTGHFVAASVDVAVNGRGDAIAIWRGRRALTPRRSTEAIQSAFRACGHGFGDVETIPEDTVAAPRTTPVVALDERGRAVASWTTGSRMMLAARGLGADGAWAPAQTLDAGPASTPMMAMTPGGAAVGAWRAKEPDSEGDGIQTGALRTVTRRSSGRLGLVQQLSDSPTRMYRIVATPAGETILAWSPAISDPPVAPEQADLRVAVRPRAGAGFGPAQILPGVRPHEFHSSLAALGDSTTLLAWADQERVRVLARGPGGVFAATPTLDVRGMYPLVVAAGRRAVGVWVVARGEAVFLVAAAGRG